jgi:hypothetical protein
MCTVQNQFQDDLRSISRYLLLTTVNATAGDKKKSSKKPLASFNRPKKPSCFFSWTKGAFALVDGITEPGQRTPATRSHYTPLLPDPEPGQLQLAAPRGCLQV